MKTLPSLVLAMLLQIHIIGTTGGHALPFNPDFTREFPPSEDSSSTTGGFPEVVKNEIVQLKEGVTLEQWRKEHSQDVITSYVPSLFERTNDTWCLCAEDSYSVPGGHTAIRKAFFYVPLPPSTMELPLLRDSLYVRNNTAILGMISVDVIEPSPQLAGTISNEVIKKLSLVLGPGDTKTKLWGFGSAGWSHTCRWANGNKIFASAYGVQDEDNRAPLIAVYGFLPISEFHVDDIDDYKELSVGGSEMNVDSILFQRAIQDLPPHQPGMSDLLSLYNKDRNDSLDLKATAAAFREWIDSLKYADSSQRARSLIFADLVLKRLEREFFGRYMWDLDRSFVAQMQSLGARLAQGRTEGYVYERSWLKQAYALSPNDASGDLAFMIMMQEGFQLEADCRDCGQCFSRIIVEGEKYLKHSKDKMFLSWTHRILGYAYNDAYCIANGFPTLSSEDKSYPLVDGNHARLKSYEHFAAALELDHKSKASREAWRSAWRVIASSSTP